MPDPDASRAQRAAGAAPPAAEAAPGQANAMLDASGRATHEIARRTSENLELMQRLAETMLSGAREASTEMVRCTRQAGERRAGATRRITQARTLEEALETQNRYLRALLALSAKVARLSAGKASGQLDQGRR